ncbi:homoserine kinase, partial [Cystoisospora suis]
ASCANLGSGFDCLGLAVGIWNDLIVEEADKEQIIIHGEGADELPRDHSNLVVCGFEAVLARLQLSRAKLPHFRFTCYNRIPVARGLGSSCAAVVAGIVAGTALAPFLQRKCAVYDARMREGRKAEGAERDATLFAMEGEWLHQAGLAVEVCDESFLLKLACDLESPRPSRELPKVGDDWLARRVPLPANLKCVLFVPEDRIETSKARAVLPKTVSLADAVYNSSRTALLVNTMSTAAAASVMAECAEDGSAAKAADAVEDILYRVLQDAMDDKLHQSYRESLNPHMAQMMEAALRAGALGVCLSGAGPSILALAMQHYAGEIAEALESAAKECKKKGVVLVVDPTVEGAHTVPLAKKDDTDGW